MRKSPKRDKLDTVGIEAICQRIEAGETQREIATSMGCEVSQLNGWLNDVVHVERFARAKAASAESWLDRGLEVIASALAKDGNVDSGAARAYAQECARRAAIRNPKYRDKQQHEHTGPNDGPITHDVAIRPAITREEWLKIHGLT